MQVLDLHVCSCEFMLELTYSNTFQGLDQTLVDSVIKLTSATYAALYIGAFEQEPGNHLILAKAYHDDYRQEEHGENIVVPVNLPSERRLSLVINRENSNEQLSDLVQLLAVYSNQHEHLNRANKDRLTGLKNRRAFEMEYANLMQEELANTSGDSDKVNVLAVLDVDHFKQVNDQHGHLIGDETLIAISNIMKDFFQRDDPLYRFGGEEFVVLMKHITLSRAEQLLDQLRITISQYAFPQVGQKTVSIGYTVLQHDLDNNLLFERADAALYKAKESGRNCLKSYEQLVEKGLISALSPREGEIELF